MKIRNTAFGFTLVEMVVAIGVVLLTLPVVYSLAFVISREQARIMVIQKLKEEGDFAMRSITAAIKNQAVLVNCPAVSPYTSQSDENKKICFQDKNNLTFGYYFTSDNNLASVSASYSEESFFSDQPKFRVSFSSTSGVVPISVSEDIIAFNYNVVYQAVLPYEKDFSLPYQYLIYLRK